MSARHDHEPVRSEMVQLPGADARFRPRCQCGRIADPMDLSEVVLAVEAHTEQATGHPDVPTPEKDG